MKRVDVVAKSNLSLPAKWLAVFMAHHVNRNGEVITSLAKIRDWTALGDTAIRASIKALEYKGFINVIRAFEPGPKSSGTFALTWGDAAPGEPSPTEIAHEARRLVSDDAETAEVSREGARLSPPSSSVLSFPVSEKDKELTQESVTEAQVAMFTAEIPNWLAALRDAPHYDLDAAREQTLIEWIRDQGINESTALSAATALAAKWDAMKRKGYKRIDLTLRNWAVGERKRESNDTAHRNGNGRYRAPGFGTARRDTPEARRAYWEEGR